MATTNGEVFSDSIYNIVDVTDLPAANNGEVFSFTGGGGTATILKYLMRGVRAGVTEYWLATSVDSTGAENPSGPSGLSSIVFLKAHLQ